MIDPVVISTSSGDQKVYTDACLKQDLQHIKDQLKEAIFKDDAELANALSSLNNRSCILQDCNKGITLAHFEILKTQARNAVNVLGCSLSPWIVTASGIVPNMMNAHTGWGKAVEGFEEVAEDAQNLMIPDWQGYAAESYRDRARELIDVVKGMAALSKKIKDTVESVSLIQFAITKFIHEIYQSFFAEMDKWVDMPVKDFLETSKDDLLKEHLYVRTLSVLLTTEKLVEHLIELNSRIDWNESAQQVCDELNKFSKEVRETSENLIKATREELVKATQGAQAKLSVVPSQSEPTNCRAAAQEDSNYRLY